jgi:hypothetical protein
VARVLASPHLVPSVLVVAAVLAGNSLYLIHIFNPDPINTVSGLGHVYRSGVIAGTMAADPNNGVTAQALGHLVAVDWLHGHLPWWNPFEGLGAPLAGEMQSAAFFPPTLLLYFSNGQVYSHALVEMVAGLSTYFLLQRCGIGRMAPTVGGIAFALNGTYSWFSHAPTNPVAFLPLLLLGVEMAARSAIAGRPLGWCVVALALALSLYAGFPEVAYIDGVLAALWTLVRAAQLGRARWHFLSKVAFGIVIGLLLAAPIIVAFLDYLPAASVGNHNGSFANASLPHSALAQTLLPYIYGSINTFTGFDKSGTLLVIWGNIGGYVTATLIVLGLIGLAGKRRRALRIVLAAWIVLAIGRTFGVSPLLHIVNFLPGMKNVAFFRYADPSWEFAIIVLAALGVDDIVRRLVRRWWILLCTLLCLGLVLLSDREAQPLLHDIQGASEQHVWAVWSLVWALALTVVVGAIALVLRGRLRSLLLFSLVVIDVTAMFVVPQLSAPRSSSIDTAPVNFLRNHLGSDRFYSLGPLAPNYGSFFALSSLDTNDLPLPTAWTNYLTRHLDTNAPKLSFDGTDRATASGPTAEQEFRAHLADFESAGVKYVLVSPGTPPLTTPSGTRLREVFSDPVVQIFQLPAPTPFFSTKSGGCFVNPAGIESVRVLCRTPHSLVRRELYMKGWSATVNGRPAHLDSYDAVYEQVRVPAGLSVVRFSFAPPHVDAATASFVLAMLVVLVVPPVVRRRSRRPAHVAGSNGNTAT